jgi:drug/metabolite transporter (DMT)-like permease
MSASDQTNSSQSTGIWIANQPYLLLCITAACWAGNAIVGRLAAGHIPPVTLSFLRWSAAFLIILPFAWCPSPASASSTRCNTGRWSTPRR